MHYFTSQPLENPGLMTVELAGRPREILTATGVFSAQRLDSGTRVLLDHLPAEPPAAGVVVDVGCGWGPVALTAALTYGTEVLAVDVNETARELTAANAQRLGVQVHATTPEDGLSWLQGRRIGLLLSNPPIRVGKDALHHILATWLPLLADDGAAYLVIAKNLGADTHQRWIISQLALNCERVASSKGYRILRVTQPHS